MPLIVQVGLSKKIGQPNYSSLGASCNLGLELDQSLLATDSEALQSRVRQAFEACRQAVQEELFQRSESTLGTGSQPTLLPPKQKGYSRDFEAASQADPPAPASRKQLEYITQLASRIPGLGLRRLEALCCRMFDQALSVLTHSNASQLIDVLKQIKEGVCELETGLEENGEA